LKERKKGTREKKRKVWRKEGEKTKGEKHNPDW